MLLDFVIPIGSFLAGVMVGYARMEATATKDLEEIECELREMIEEEEDDE